LFDEAIIYQINLITTGHSGEIWKIRISRWSGKKKVQFVEILSDLYY